MDWATRVKVAAGAARGIAYLHEDCKYLKCLFILIMNYYLSLQRLSFHSVDW